MENKKTNSLVVFLIIVILVLCATVGFLLVYDKNDESENKPDVNENNPGTNVDEPTDPVLQDISLDDVDVKTIIDKFGLTMDKHDAVWQMDLYVDSKLKDDEMARIAYHVIEGSIKQEENCTEQLFDGYGYYCKYISYEDFNSEYKKLSGKDLAKTDLDIELYDLKYDSNKNIYRIYNVFAGGGTPMTIFSKLDKASKMGDYIYIYEKVAFVWPEDTVTLQNPHLYKHTDMGFEYTTDSTVLGKYEQLQPYDNPNLILNNYIDRFDTYKWTFKKDSNGNYVYENLEFVESGKVDTVYYEFGNPTTQSSTNYMDVINKTGMNAFVKRNGNDLSVCIYRNNMLECFKTNNYQEEIKHVESVFGSVNCDRSTADRYCYDPGTSGFRCDIYADNSVYCCAEQCCEVSSDGTVRCGAGEY